MKKDKVGDLISGIEKHMMHWRGSSLHSQRNLFFHMWVVVSIFLVSDLIGLPLALISDCQGDWFMFPNTHSCERCSSNPQLLGVNTPINNAYVSTLPPATSRRRDFRKAYTFWLSIFSKIIFIHFLVSKFPILPFQLFNLHFPSLIIPFSVSTYWIHFSEYQILKYSIKIKSYFIFSHNL